ncbi:hypothetical protein FMUBM48_24930 [Nocardia cyriacigeorgica]|nr:hypothetical protein FMUBM48_24930 [Nocardia cyriacigeorgica]
MTYGIRAHPVRGLGCAAAWLQVIVGHIDPRITQKYMHPDIDGVRADGDKLSRHPRGELAPNWPQASVRPSNKKSPPTQVKGDFSVSG